MTVREELERIKDRSESGKGPEWDCDMARMASALLAVLDLHTEDKFGECRACRVDCPCDTLLEIERELGREVDRG